MFIHRWAAGLLGQCHPLPQSCGRTWRGTLVTQGHVSPRLRHTPLGVGPRAGPPSYLTAQEAVRRLRTWLEV